MLDVEQGAAEQLDLLGLEVVHVAAAYDHVLDLGIAADVVEGLLPAFAADAEVDLVHVGGVEADRVGTRAEAAVHGTGVQGQEQGPVVVAVREPGHGRVGLLVQRIEIQLGMVGLVPRTKRQELKPDRIGLRRRPVDQ